MRSDDDVKDIAKAICALCGSEGIGAVDSVVRMLRKFESDGRAEGWSAGWNRCKQVIVAIIACRERDAVSVVAKEVAELPERIEAPPPSSEYERGVSAAAAVFTRRAEQYRKQSYEATDIADAQKWENFAMREEANAQACAVALQLAKDGESADG